VCCILSYFEHGVIQDRIGITLTMVRYNIHGVSEIDSGMASNVDPGEPWTWVDVEIET
jgi:hypothetical protein